MERWRGWRVLRTGRRGLRRAFWRITLRRGARTKSGQRRQWKDPRSRNEGRWGWQEAGWESVGWEMDGWASEPQAIVHICFSKYPYFRAT
jgi:hypothetical protein